MIEIFFNSRRKFFSIFFLIVSIIILIENEFINFEYLIIRLFHSLLIIKHSLIIDEQRPTLPADYRAFEELLKMRPIQSINHNDEPIKIIQKLRLSLTMKNLIPKPRQCQIEKNLFQFQNQTIETYWINYYSKNQELVEKHFIIYLHGGAYAFGDIQSYSGIECHLSRLFNLRLLHIEYRLSPEHRLPAAVDDSIQVYRMLINQNISSSNIILMGDSAGGGLALLTVQSLIAKQISIPSGLILLSPWTDLSGSSQSYIQNRHKDVLLCSEKMKWLVQYLIDPNQTISNLNNPIFSPLFGSFEGFPPIYITVGTAEILQDDSRRLVDQTTLVNKKLITFEQGEHLMHVYPIFFLYYQQARNTLENIKIWIQTIFNSSHDSININNQ